MIGNAIGRWGVLAGILLIGCGGGTEGADSGASPRDASMADGGTTDASPPALDAANADSGPTAPDAAAADAATADAGATTTQPVWLVLNGISSVCPRGLRPSLWSAVRPILDGAPEKEIGVGRMYLPDLGSHDLLLEYNTFDCFDTFSSRSMMASVSQRTLFAVSGTYGAERVTEIDLSGRWDPGLTRLILIHLSPTSGPLPYVVEGTPTTSGTFAYEDVVIAPIDPMATTPVTVMAPMPTSATSRWAGFGSDTTDAVFCVFRDHSAGAPVVECSAMTIF